MFSRVVEKGEVFVVPRGLLHFQYNVGKNKARTYTVFNSQKPGVINSPIALFASLPLIPDEVLVKSYMLDTNLVQVIRDKFAPARQPLKWGLFRLFGRMQRLFWDIQFVFYFHVVWFPMLFFILFFCDYRVFNLYWCSDVPLWFLWMLYYACHYFGDYKLK